MHPRWLAHLLAVFRPFRAILWWLLTALVFLFKVPRIYSSRWVQKAVSLSPEHPQDDSKHNESSINGSHTPGRASVDGVASVSDEQQSVDIPIAGGTTEGLLALVNRLAKGPSIHTNSDESSPSDQQLPSDVPSGVLSPSETPSGQDTTTTTPLSPNGQPQWGDITDEYELARPEFTRNGYLITRSQEKKGVRISMDTQSEVSIMRSVVFDKLGLPLEPCEQSLVSFRIAGDTTLIPTIGKVPVDWRFAQGVRTYQTDFYVVENDQFDVLIGSPTISQYKLLQPSSDIPKVMSVIICCDGPHETEQTLLASFAGNSEVNILTPLGHQCLMLPLREGSETRIKLTDGRSITVRQFIKLRIWLHASKISEEEDFYLLEDINDVIPNTSGVHAILGQRSSIYARMFSDQNPSLCPIGISRKSKEDRDKQEKRHAEAKREASEAERKRCETEVAKGRAARESRGNHDPGARR
ncbi:hypothetical protein BO85DRAFT_515911 [Aspergillus piperis CBS 112811]|uniref:Uncharacterized protein n=1 Tax=Aspergillus piperis CBS 112811 TaxID=1448313 RepID=A0A8G1RDU5_9EURO|nr:hypothetical protein BO85DRAFT_515911 [Aspergillus piperis CBS 112811]RAH63406.1 hypothetical protein BO85DRAFT_515911 [Aspergillus piperis CBS 112811]